MADESPDGRGAPVPDLVGQGAPVPDLVGQGAPVGRGAPVLGLVGEGALNVNPPLPAGLARGRRPGRGGLYGALLSKRLAAVQKVICTNQSATLDTNLQQAKRQVELLTAEVEESKEQLRVSKVRRTEIYEELELEDAIYVSNEQQAKDAHQAKLYGFPGTIHALEVKSQKYLKGQGVPHKTELEELEDLED